METLLLRCGWVHWGCTGGYAPAHRELADDVNNKYKATHLVLNDSTQDRTEMEIISSKVSDTCG